MVSKQKILIVDDDNNIAELISLYLTKECFETKLVYDGEQALKAVKDFAPNLVLLDIMLPGIDGYEVLREIRRGGSLPVIMLSAKGETFDRVLGLELGADDYIMKPFDSKEMVARVKAVLRRSTKATVGESTPTPTPQVPQQELEIVTFPDLLDICIAVCNQFSHFRRQFLRFLLQLFLFFFFFILLLQYSILLL